MKCIESPDSFVITSQISPGIMPSFTIIAKAHKSNDIYIGNCGRGQGHAILYGVSK